MDLNTFETMLTPYTKLAHANMELLQTLPGPKEGRLQGNAKAQNHVARAHAPSGKEELPTNFYVNFWAQATGNWMEFWADLSKNMALLVGQHLQTAVKQYHDILADVSKTDGGHGTARRSRTTAS